MTLAHKRCGTPLVKLSYMTNGARFIATQDPDGHIPYRYCRTCRAVIR